MITNKCFSETAQNNKLQNSIPFPLLLSPEVAFPQFPYSFLLEELRLTSLKNILEGKRLTRDYHQKIKPKHGQAKVSERMSVLS